jgi:AcrR family transcriptional regulator
VMLTWPLSFWAASWGFCHGSRAAPFLVVPAGPPCDSAMRLALIQESRPAVVVLTPSYAVALGEAARSTGIAPVDFGVRGLLVGGETFGETKRRLVEELWNLPGGTRNFYGISAGGPLFAVECEAQDGLHLFEGDTIRQFWKPGTNEPAQPGEIGEHVFASISQRTMATWFNFRSRDGARYADEPCRCGRHTRRLWVAERLDDMVKVKGINVFALGVEDLLANVPGVGREFFLVIDQVAGKETLKLEVEIQPEADAQIASALIAQQMQRAWSINFVVECLPPDTLSRPRGRRGAGEFSAAQNRATGWPVAGRYHGGLPAKGWTAGRTPMATSKREPFTLEDYLNGVPAPRRKIIDAAASLFRSRGFSFVTMNDIAAAVGLSKAGLYHHCPSKEELLADMVMLCNELLKAQLARVKLMDMPAVERLRAFVVTRMETIAKYQDLFSIVWQERPYISSESFGNIAKGTEKYRSDVRDLINEAKRSHALRADVDAHLLMLAIDGMTGWAYIWFRSGRSHEPAGIGEAFWDFISRGVLASKEPAATARRKAVALR